MTKVTRRGRRKKRRMGRRSKRGKSRMTRKGRGLETSGRAVTTALKGYPTRMGATVSQIHRILQRRDAARKVRQVRTMASVKLALARAVRRGAIRPPSGWCGFKGLGIKPIWRKNAICRRKSRSVKRKGRSVRRKSVRRRNKSVLGRSKSVRCRSKSVRGRSKSVRGRSKSVRSKSVRRKSVRGRSKSVRGRSKSVLGRSKSVKRKSMSVRRVGMSIRRKSKSVRQKSQVRKVGMRRGVCKVRKRRLGLKRGRPRGLSVRKPGMRRGRSVARKIKRAMKRKPRASNVNNQSPNPIDPNNPNGEEQGDGGMAPIWKAYSCIIS